MRERTVRWIYHGMCDRRVTRAAMRWIGERASGQRIELSTADLLMPHLPEAANGLRILLVSDLHLCNDGPDLASILEVAHRVAHDLVVYTGDFLNDDCGQELVVLLLRDMPKGRRAYAVLGNHDYYGLRRSTTRNDVERLLKTISEAGIIPLRNSSVRIDEWDLHIVGVDDPVTGQSHLGRAREGVPEGAAALLLSHTPDIVSQLGGWQPVLVLAGHTHGGQIVLPVLGPLVRVTSAPRRVSSGHHWYMGVPMYVSRGVGCSGFSLRIRCAPELVSITLRTPGQRDRRPPAEAAGLLPGR